MIATDDRPVQPRRISRRARWRWRRGLVARLRRHPRHATLTRVLVVCGLLAVYSVSLWGYHELAQGSQALQTPDLGSKEDFIVLITAQSMHPIDNRLTVTMELVPTRSMLQEPRETLTEAVLVRLQGGDDLHTLNLAVGTVPVEQTVSIVADGDPQTWPFDTYRTPVLHADEVIGDGPSAVVHPARVEFGGSLDGWDAEIDRSGSITQSGDRPDDAELVLRRAKGPLVFGLGICLVLISLPVLALSVALPTFRGRKQFTPTFLGWFSGMLFAVVPLRTTLPGSPPFGAYVDQALVLWVVILLVTAMALFVVAYHRRAD